MGYIVAAIVFLGIAFLLKSSMNKDIEQEKSLGIIYSDNYASYIGGLSDVEGGKSVKVSILNEKIVLDFTRTVQKADEFNPPTVIKMDNINYAEIKSEEQLRNDISVGRILVLGILAFGKQKQVVNNYTLINYQDNNTERNLVLQSPNNETLVKTIKKIKNL